MKKDIAVIVNSCDAFEDTWNPFFKLLRIFWSDCEYPIYLNTEEKRPEFEDVKVINHKSSDPWSNRLIHSIKLINTKYLILILDDFFINERVDSLEINRCIDAMERDKSIAVFSFAPSKWIDIDDHAFDKFELRPVEGEYRFNMQAALWRKKDLLRILRKNESPWQTENRGNFRARVLLPNKKFYAAKKFCPRVINYEYGGAIHRGKWTVATPNLLEKYGIDGIDFDRRGFDMRPTSDWEKMELELPFASPKRRSLKIRFVEYLYAIGILHLK